MQHQIPRGGKAHERPRLSEGTNRDPHSEPEVLGGPRRADFILYGLPNLPLAGLEAKRKKRERTFILEQNGF